MPWVSRGELELLRKQLADVEARALAAESRLDAERAEKDRVTTHVLSMFLRAKEMGAYPVPPKDAEQPAAEIVPSYDPGELAAQIEAGRAMGIPEQEVVQRYFEWKGMPIPPGLKELTIGID
jgi:hypothetical protein